MAKDGNEVIRSQAARLRQITEAILSPLLSNDPIFKQLLAELERFFSALGKKPSLVFEVAPKEKVMFKRLKQTFYSGLLDILEALCLAFPKLELKAFKDVLAVTFQWN